jgi:hypothetical protein
MPSTVARIKNQYNTDNTLLYSYAFNEVSEWAPQFYISLRYIHPLAQSNNSVGPASVTTSDWLCAKRWVLNTFFRAALVAQIQTRIPSISLASADWETHLGLRDYYAFRRLRTLVSKSESENRRSPLFKCVV